MLDIRRMKVLREVAAKGSFSAAAEALNFTQSAVSQHIAALERETGTQLVERFSRGVRLTEAGTVLVTHADAILARLDSAEEDLAAIAGLRGGRLRLVCFQSAGATVVPRAVATFHGRHPDVELSLREAEPEEAAALLKSGDVDLALVYDHPATMLVPEPRADPPARRLLRRAAARRATSSPTAAASRSPTSRTIRGSSPRAPAAAARSPSPPAATPASSRAWPSRPTRRSRPRRSWRPAWA